MLKFHISIDDGELVARDLDAEHPSMDRAVEAAIQAALAMAAEAISPANDNQSVSCEIRESGTLIRRSFDVSIAVSHRR